MRAKDYPKYKEFKMLARALRKAGYKVRTFKEDGSMAASSKSKGIKLCFCTPLDSAWHDAVNGKISADNIIAFDRWSRCPLTLPLPENECEIKFIIEKLEFISSPEGYEFSLDFNQIDEYPNFNEVENA